MTPPPADLLPCRKCGKPLSDGKPVDGIVMSIKDNHGVYHAECWGDGRPQPIAGDGWEEAIEAAAKAAANTWMDIAVIKRNGETDEVAFCKEISTRIRALRRPAQPEQEKNK